MQLIWFCKIILYIILVFIYSLFKISWCLFFMTLFVTTTTWYIIYCYILFLLYCDISLLLVVVYCQLYFRTDILLNLDTIPIKKHQLYYFRYLSNLKKCLKRSINNNFHRSGFKPHFKVFSRYQLYAANLLTIMVKRNSIHLFTNIILN